MIVDRLGMPCKNSQDGIARRLAWRHVDIASAGMQPFNLSLDHEARTGMQIARPRLLSSKDPEVHCESAIKITARAEEASL